MIRFTPFERVILGNSGITYPQLRKLAKAIRQYRFSDDNARQNFASPYRRWGAPIRRWVLLKLAIDNPPLVIFGPVVAALLYIYLCALFVSRIMA